MNIGYVTQLSRRDGTLLTVGFSLRRIHPKDKIQLRNMLIM